MENVKLGDITLTSLETITCFDYATGNYWFTLDELQNATIANTEDRQDITGKGGRKINVIKRNKAVTVSGANGMLSGNLMEAQTGGKFESQTSAEVMWTDYMVISKGKATTTYKAVGTPGNEVELYVRQPNGVHGVKLTQNSDAQAENSFKYTPSSKEIQVNTNIQDGTEVVAYYKRHVAADVLANASDKYSKKAKAYIDAFGEDRCGKICHVQIFLPKMDFKGEFSIEMGDNQTVHNFEMESLASTCGLMNQAGVLWTYTVLGEDAPDAEK